MADLAQLRTEAEGAIHAAGSAAELATYGSATWAASRADRGAALDRRAATRAAGPVGKQANEVREALEALLEAGRRSWRPPSSTGASSRTAWT